MAMSSTEEGYAFLVEPISTALAGIALVKASVDGIKSALGTAKDISAIAGDIDALLNGQQQVQAASNKKGGMGIADQFGVEDGQWVEISSRRGMVKARVQVTDICQPGMVSMTFHFVETPTNEITNPALDPIAKIPETKVSAVKITPVPE